MIRFSSITLPFRALLCLSLSISCTDAERQTKENNNRQITFILSKKKKKKEKPLSVCPLITEKVLIVFLFLLANLSIYPFSSSQTFSVFFVFKYIHFSDSKSNFCRQHQIVSNSTANCTIRTGCGNVVK